MSDNREVVSSGRDAPIGMPLTVYILFLATFVLAVPWLIAGVLAYVFRGGPDWQQSHFRFQIRTFWIGILFAIVATLTIPLFGLGFLLGGLASLWALIRSIRGLLLLLDREAIPDPASWAFGGSRR